jgi:PPM family protein phosphatase
MLEAFALTDKGCVRSNNEDYCLVKPELGLYVLADGMGGAKAGERASRLAVDTVAESVTTAGRRETQVLLSAVEEANRKVLAAANSDPNMEGMGTTLVVALETDEGVAIASVGDSRAYILDDNGLRVITQDQTWVNDVGRPLGLDEESLRSHPMRHVLTMAIGAGTPLAINYYMVRPSPAAMLLICSDGLHGVVDRTRIEEILRGNGNGSSDSLEQKCHRLIDEAKSAGGPDNITAVLMRAPGAPELPPLVKSTLQDTQPI